MNVFWRNPNCQTNLNKIWHGVWGPKLGSSVALEPQTCIWQNLYKIKVAENLQISATILIQKDLGPTTPSTKVLQKHNFVNFGVTSERNMSKTFHRMLTQYFIALKKCHKNVCLYGKVFISWWALIDRSTEWTTAPFDLPPEGSA